MDFRFEGKAIVITGASRGIGRRLAGRFANAGGKVVFGARRIEPLKALESELRKNGHEAIAVAADVGKYEDCQRLVQTAVDAWGTVDILVNNAGISGVQKLIRDLEPEEFDEVMRVNLYSAYACTRFAAKYMMEQKSGCIVNISALTYKRPVAMRTPYATSRAGLVGLTRTVAVELAPYKIRCNAISPGPVEGERVEEVVNITSKSRNMPPEEVRKLFLSWSPMNEMVTEEEICDMVFFLCSDSGRHMTGQDINMTAGIVMY